MVVKLLNEKSIVERTIGRVVGVLNHRNGDLHLDFDDGSSLEIERSEFEFYYVLEK